MWECHYAGSAKSAQIMKAEQFVIQDGTPGVENTRNNNFHLKTPCLAFEF